MLIVELANRLPTWVDGGPVLGSLKRVGSSEVHVGMSYTLGYSQIAGLNRSWMSHTLFIVQSRQDRLEIASSYNRAGFSAALFSYRYRLIVPLDVKHPAGQTYSIVLHVAPWLLVGLLIQYLAEYSFCKIQVGSMKKSVLPSAR